jgi:hypothetical protein
MTPLSGWTKDSIGGYPDSMISGIIRRILKSPDTNLRDNSFRHIWFSGNLNIRNNRVNLMMSHYYQKTALLAYGDE